MVLKAGPAMWIAHLCPLQTCVPCVLHHVLLNMSVCTHPNPGRIAQPAVTGTPSLLGFSRPPFNPVVVGQLRGNSLVTSPVNNQLCYNRRGAYMPSEHSQVRAVATSLFTLHV